MIKRIVAGLLACLPNRPSRHDQKYGQWLWNRLELYSLQLRGQLSIYTKFPFKAFSRRRESVTSNARKVINF